jgi:carbamate kinase
MSADVPSGLLVAVGGNSLIRAGQRGTADEQRANAVVTAGILTELIAAGHRLVITHGNGPQVGAQLLRSELSATQAYPLSLDVCVAATQGEIGYLLQGTLQAMLQRRNIHATVATIITQVEVDPRAGEFLRPSKPIGPFYSKDMAGEKARQLGWVLKEDAARGYRRVVASPEPLAIVELEIIRACLGNGFTVIAAGGGGIPVVREGGGLVGVEAVIDKDHASALLANELKIEKLLISTDVEHVYLNYQRANQQAIHEMGVREAEHYLEKGHFLEGSMKPKIEAAISFLRHGGKEVVISDPEHLLAAFAGKGGTRIV